MKDLLHLKKSLTWRPFAKIGAWFYLYKTIFHYNCDP